jgi:hypothetical protein
MFWFSIAFSFHSVAVKGKIYCRLIENMIWMLPVFRGLLWCFKCWRTEIYHIHQLLLFFATVKDIILSSLVKNLMFRICLQVTPPSPVVLATCPVIQFAVYQPFSLEYIHQHGIYTSIEVHSACAGSSLPSSTGLHQCGLGILSWFSLFICLTTPFLLLQILSIYC